MSTSEAPEPVLQKWEDEDGLVNYSSTVSTDGGWAKIQWNSNKVAVIDTYAQTGYTAGVKQEGAIRVSVSFESAGKATSIEAWWDDDQPMLDVNDGAD